MKRWLDAGMPRRARAGLMVAAALALVVAAVALSGCGNATTGSSSPSPASTSIKMGGVLKVGQQPGNGGLDPVLHSDNVADIMVQEQILEKLVDLDPGFKVVPRLAKEWSSTDNKVWKFTLQEGVSFSNGDPFTADDVVYSMSRLRSKKLGSPMADIFANVVDVTADDPTHVTFTLKKADSEFPSTLTDYRCLMLDKNIKDPNKQAVGTGPFTLESQSLEDRSVLKKNPNYWAKDEQGNQLPYLDEIDFIYSPEKSAQIQGLLGGQLQWVGGLTSEQKQTVEGNAGFQILSSKTNYCFELQIRCDQGPGADLKFRQALWAGTDRQAIVDLAAPGVADPGNGTLVGPAYSQYYLAEAVPYDVNKAKQLLSESSYNGEAIKLVAQTIDLVPAMATVWQQQMKAIGVNVQIQEVTPDVFYADKGTDNWYKADFCIVDWGSRATPVTYFQLALTSAAPWNYSRWKNAQFDAISAQIPTESDLTKRSDLYKQAQQILMDEVPMINFLVTEGLAAQPDNVAGITLLPDWSQTLFTTAHYTN
jgi:peptide/nickel transport system substrate-binding protein